MARVADIVSRALRILRVVDAHSAPSAQEMTDGIVALNGMMRRWEANGLALGWSDVEGPDDQVPAPDEAHEAIVYNLALKMRPEYGAALEPDVVQHAADGHAALRRDVLTASPLQVTPRSPREGRYNIYTDSWD